MIYLFLFIFGLCVGSFLNVLIYREAQDEEEKDKAEKKSLKTRKRQNKKQKRINWQEKRINWQDWLPSWAKGRSVCDYCSKQLNWYDNIPLLSYILLKGKCRYCQKKISFQYPLVEFLTGIQFIWIYFLIQGNLNFFSRFEGFYSLLSLMIFLFLGACFLAILVADIKYQIIPDGAVFGGIFLALFKIFIDYRYTGMINFSFLSAALLAGLFFLGLVLITKAEGMGIGDIKLAVLMGLVLGFPRILFALSFAFLTGAFIGVILILLGRKGLKSQIAFGPFLILGTIFALFL